MGADFPNAIKVLPLFDTCWLLLLNVTSMKNDHTFDSSPFWPSSNTWSDLITCHFYDEGIFVGFYFIFRIPWVACCTSEMKFEFIWLL